MIPLGFEYDFKLPLEGLYLAARISAGYGLVGTYNTFTTHTLHFGFITPELALKYVVHRRWNLGIEPFGLPIALGRDDDAKLVLPISYRLLLSFGANL
jgi:hypothetical protein